MSLNIKDEKTHRMARELARITGFNVFHKQLAVDLLLSIFEFGSKPFVELREEIWLSVFRQAAENDVPGLIFTFSFNGILPGVLIFLYIKFPKFPQLKEPTTTSGLPSPSRSPAPTFVLLTSCICM